MATVAAMNLQQAHNELKAAMGTERAPLAYVRFREAVRALKAGAR